MYLPGIAPSLLLLSAAFIDGTILTGINAHTYVTVIPSSSFSTAIYMYTYTYYIGMHFGASIMAYRSPG